MHANKLRLLLFILFWLPYGVKGQQTPAEPFVRQAPIVKFSPLSLLDGTSSIQFALEHQLGKHTALQHEAGFILPVNNFDTGIHSKYGVRLRNEFRLYLTPGSNQLRGLYIAPELLFMYYRGYRNEVFGRECDGTNGCAYFEYMDHLSQKQVYGLHQKIGLQEVIFKRVVVDIYAGLGFRHVRVREYDRPEFTNWRGFIDFRKQHGNHTLPSLSLGFKVGYILRSPHIKRPVGKG